MTTAPTSTPASATARRSTPDYPAGLVGTVIGLTLAAAFVVWNVPSPARPMSQVWGAFYVPFLIAICYYAITEHELESKRYASMADALTPRWQLVEYIVRIFLAAFFGLIIGLPFGIVPLGLRTPGSGYPLECFNELEFRLCLLILAHLCLVTWDMLIICAQHRDKAPLVWSGTILGDIAGGLGGLLAIWLLGASADPQHRDLAGFNVSVVVIWLLAAYASAAGKIGFVFVQVLASAAREFFQSDWDPQPRGRLGPNWKYETTRVATALGFVGLLVILVLAVYKSLDLWPCD